MSGISNELLFLQACSEHLPGDKFFKTLSSANGEKTANKPRWEWIVCHEDSSLDDIHRLLKIIGAKEDSTDKYLLNKEQRLSLFSRRTGNGERILEVLLRRARCDERCLIQYFSLLSDLTEQERFEHLHGEKHQESFARLLCCSTSTAKSNILFQEMSKTNKLTTEHQLAIYSYQAEPGEPLLAFFARHKNGLLDNGFMVLMEEFAKLLKTLEGRTPTITKASVYNQIFKREDVIQAYYQNVIKNQPGRAIYYMMRSGVVPESHYNYLKEARRKVLDYIEGISPEESRYEQLLYLRNEENEVAKMLQPSPGRFFSLSRGAWHSQLDTLIEKYRPIWAEGLERRGAHYLISAERYFPLAPSAPPYVVAATHTEYDDDIESQYGTGVDVNPTKRFIP